MDSGAAGETRFNPTNTAPSKPGLKTGEWFVCLMLVEIDGQCHANFWIDTKCR
jgi:hypothetical protein